MSVVFGIAARTSVLPSKRPDGRELGWVRVAEPITDRLLILSAYEETEYSEVDLDEFMKPSCRRRRERGLDKNKAIPFDDVLLAPGLYPFRRYRA